MSTRYLTAVIFLLVALTDFSCKKDHDDNNGSCANNTGWLANGHQAVFENTPIFIFADSLFVTYTEASPGSFQSTSQFDDGTSYPAQTNYLQACNNSIYQAATSDLANKQEAYRIDGNVGNNWTATTTSTGGNTITTTTTITEKNVAVTVPAGTFSCIHFHQVSTSSAGGSVETDTYVNNAAGPVLVDGTSVHYELARKNY